MQEERRIHQRRSSDERLAVLEDRYGSLDKRVDALETVLKEILDSVDNMSEEIVRNREESKNGLEDLGKLVAKNTNSLAPLAEIQKEARSTFRFLRRITYYVVLPSFILYLAVSGVPAADDAIKVLVKALKLLM
jgi:chromosome segregation ATPase